MHPQQRHARFNLIVASVSLILMLISGTMLLLIADPRTAMASFGFLGLMGLTGFGGAFYRRKNKNGPVVMDERDLAIQRQSMLVGWGAVWLFFGLACMGPWGYFAITRGTAGINEGAIPVSFLPMAYIGALVVHTIAWSVSVLWQYGTEDGTDGGE
jgi:hypothetical protein